MTGPQPRTEKYIVDLLNNAGQKLCFFAEGPYPGWVERWAREKYEKDEKSPDFARVTAVRVASDEEDKWRLAQNMKYLDTLP